MHHIYSTVLDFYALLTSVRLLEKNMLWLCVLSVALMLIRRWRQPAELVTTVAVQKNLPTLPAISLIPQGLFLLALLSINVWLAKPVIPLIAETRTMETRDIFIAVDKSGSMDTIIKDAEGNEHGRRIDAAAHAVDFFVARRQGDRIGLAVFDDNTYLHWPMTDDLQIIRKKTELIPRFVNGGTNIEGTTGPIQSVIDYWKEYGTAKTKVLIFVSDGDAPLTPERIAELTKEMNALGGKLYMLGVGETWNDLSKTDEKQEPLKKLVAALGGKIYSVADEQQMLDAVADIDKLEKSTVKVEINETFRDVSIYFAFASCLLFSLFLASVAFTRERA